MYQLSQQYKLRDILIWDSGMVDSTESIWINNIYSEYEAEWKDPTDFNYRKVYFDSLLSTGLGSSYHYSYLNSSLYCNIPRQLSDFLTYNVQRERYMVIWLRNLYFKYKNCTINYDNPIDFLTDLKLKLLTVIERYARKWQYIQELYELSTEDFQTIQTSINATAINDNTTLEKPLDNMAEYVSNQLGNKIKESTVSAILRKIDTLRDEVMLDFINEVKPLFISVIPQQNYFYGD